MKAGFTLLELMIVVIIIGVLATLGVLQYQGAIEKARGAEAKQILGQMRSMCAAIYMGEGSANNCSATNLRVGTAAGWIPSSCATTHYFSYAAAPGASSLTSTATRCTASGKSPQGASAGTLILDTNFSTGTDSWSGTGGY